MKLDIRLPVGVLFTFLGVVLTAYGWLGDKTIYARSLGININLGWGFVLLLFGLTMMLLGSRKTQETQSRPLDP